MARIRADFVAGALDTALAAGGTSMSSPALADLPAVASPDIAAISLYTADSNGRITKKEIVYVTAHTAAATTATIERAKEGTTDQAWSSGDKWEHAATKVDFDAHAYDRYRAAMLEPLAIEPLKAGTFSYAVGATETKLVVNAFNTRLGASGRWELRDPTRPMPLRGVTLTGLGASASGIIIDPTLPTYADAAATYLDRLNTLATTAQRYAPISTPSTRQAFLPGPYGTIITSVSVFDSPWLILRPYGTAIGWNLHDELGDAAAESIRFAHPTIIPVSKRVACTMELGVERTGGNAEASLTYVILPASWGAIADPNTYAFRDDFMGASLDTTTKWQRAESTAGNIEIDTAWQWCKATGNTTWGANSLYSRTGAARTGSPKFMVDIFTGSSAADATPDMVGFSDGAGFSYTNLLHALNFTNAVGGALTIKAYEGGTDRGVVGSGYSANSIYRVRITALAAGGATYEIQGGSEYPAIGGATWTNITPGTTAGTAATVYAGMAKYTPLASYRFSDMRLYT